MSDIVINSYFNRYGKYNSSEDLSKYRPSYVYELKFKVENKIYIGSRKSKSVLVEDDFWVDYFTSSNVVAKLLLEYDSQEDDFWEFRILEQFFNYEDAVNYENLLLRSIIKEDKSKYLNINFSAGGSIIRSNQHRKYTNIKTGKTELFPIDTLLPDGYIKNTQVPPSRLGFKKWIDPITFITGIDHIDNMPPGTIIKTEYDKQLKILKREKYLEEIKIKRETRIKHTITNGRYNKTVYTDLPIPDGWYIGKTIYTPAMLGRKHSIETRLLMSKNMKGSKSNIIPWNKGLSKKNNE